MRYAGLLLCFTVLLGCRSTPEPDRAFTLVNNSGIEFTNKVTNTPELNIFNYRTFYNGGGVAIGDINNDGLPDVCLTANMGANKLFLNKGNFQFEDITEQAGIALADRWSTGVVMADVNNDGWLDIYISNAGYGDAQRRENALFINNKDLSFTNRAREYGLADSGYTTQTVFFDYDLDGDLDAYILNNSLLPVNNINAAGSRHLRAEDWPVASHLKGNGNRLMRNDHGHFTDVSQTANIYNSLMGFGLGVAVGDVNGDRYPDIYISNDFFEKDYLYINQGDGTFKEELENRIQHISHSSMGVDIGDLNNDDHPDIFVTEMLPDDEVRLKTTTAFENADIQKLKKQSGYYNQFQQNTLQVSNGNGKFLETAFYSGVAASDWSWCGLFFDADNDGLNDIYVSNGIYNNVTDQDFIDFFANDVIQQMVLTGQKEDISEIISKMPSQPVVNKLYRNKGGLQFEDKAADWGMSTPSFTNGAAYADLDNDGDLDLVENNVNQPAFIYRNNSREQTKHHFIGFRLKGDSLNPFAVGALVKVFAGGQVMSRELFPVRGFQSSMDYTIEVGLGDGSADSVQVIWPNRKMTVLEHPAVNQFVQLSEKDATRKWMPAPVPAKPLLAAVPLPTLLSHQEDDYNDFNYERNIPAQLSREGPALAQADVNGDGRADLFIGGGTGQASQLYLQSANGWVLSPQPDIAAHHYSDAVTALFFDADGDKDADLLVGTGGNFHVDSAGRFDYQLYLNNGRGQFSFQPNAFPVNRVNTAVAAATDLDGDGDLDLFVGSRSVPAQYGVTPPSFIFLNDGKGHFSDGSRTWLGEAAKMGMVTAASWNDLDGDGRPELVVAGEWMQPKIFSIHNQRLEPWPDPFAGLNGWWQSVTVADLDKDGRPDLVLGNIGRNFYLQPKADAPVKLFLNDFDGNGSLDKILTRRVKDRDLPVFMKRELSDQLPSLMKQNLKHVEYATKSINDLFGDDLVALSTIKSFTEAGSCIAWNEGGGKFSRQYLPLELQLSSVNTSVATDLNRDGLPDLIVAGNLNIFQPQFGAIDAGFGWVLMNRGQRQFSVLRAAASGLDLGGMTRRMVQVPVKGKSLFLFARNNATPLGYMVQ